MNILELDKFIENIQNGFPGIFQTDTLPALSAKPEFCDQIWNLKKRSKNKPLILMGASSEELFDSIDEKVLDDAIRMSKKYWPGPLTLVLPCREEKSIYLNHLKDSIGLRVPNSQVAISLLKKTGPLATTSANLSGVTPSLDISKISKDFPNVPFLGPIPWTDCSFQASTVIKWISKGNWTILRKGSIIPKI
tara:strand:- start:227 stop:802 length:576 start_codon:yes stop_codon:yes gene_type:complete